MEQGRSGRALVVGGDSLVGSALKMYCRKLGSAVDATSRRPGSGAPGTVFLDLGTSDFAPLQNSSYDVAFLCAAVTSMQACQGDPEGSRRINVDNTLELMRRLADRGTHLVFLSSSQVFDGETPMPDEGSPTGPKNEYGAQKLAVEEAIERQALPAAVLRVTKVLADHPVGVFKGWFEALTQGQPVQAATNMALAPVMVGDVAEAAERLAAGRHRGIWHLGSSDEIGYFDAARLMAETRHLPVSLVRGGELTEDQVPSIYRHRYVTIGCEKVARTLAMPIRRARDILDTLFAAFPQPGAGTR